MSFEGRPETQVGRGTFTFRHIGGNHIVIYPHPDKNTNSAFVMDGNDLTFFINIPFLHRIVKLELIHLDTNFAKSTDALLVRLELEAGRSLFGAKYTNYLFNQANIVTAEFSEIFGDGFEYEPRTWTF